MPDYDYKQIAKTPEYLKNYEGIFPKNRGYVLPLTKGEFPGEEVVIKCTEYICSSCGTPVSPTSGVFYPTYAKCINCAYKEVEFMLADGGTGKSIWNETSQSWGTPVRTGDGGTDK